jgi:hypothetical protein
MNLPPVSRRKVDSVRMGIEGAEANVLREPVNASTLRHIKQAFVEYHRHINPREDRLSQML